MTSTVRQIAYRLQSDGKADVIRDSKEVGAAIRGSYEQAEAGANAASAAAERQEQRYRRLAAAARDSAQADAAQARYNAALGVTQGGGGARDSAAVFIAQAAAMEDAERRAQALRTVLDPLGAAQDRLNAEMAEYKALATAGKISTTELGQAQAMARARFDEATASIDRQGRGLTRNALASRLNLARQGADVAVTAAMGMNPAMIAIQQGPQILDAWATSGLKVRASMLLLGGAISAVAAGTVVMAAAWHDAEQQGLKLERVTSGLGRTSGLTAREAEAMAQAAAAASGVSVRAARDMAAAYLSTGRIGGDVLQDLIGLTKDYASFTGQDAEKATQDLAKAMVAPDKAGREMTRTFGLLDQATLATIDSLMKQGDRLAAQKILLEALSGAVHGHAEQVGEIESAWDAASRAISNAYDNLGRFLYRTRDERIAELGNRLSQPASGPAARLGFRNPVKEREEYDRLVAERDAAEAREKAALGSAQRNQRAQLRVDEADRPRRGNRSAEREAEREAREAKARARREEDRQAMLDLEVARATNDYATIQRLEEANAVRERERQLIDDGATAEAARTKALEEQARLMEARGVAIDREIKAMGTQSEIAILRAGGEERYARNVERRVEMADRIEFYESKGKDHVTATAMATAELVDLERARAQLMQQNLAAKERERQIDLAIARGDRATADRLGRDAWIDRRAREIEGADSDNPLNRGEGNAQAAREWAEAWSAEAEGARREWAKGFAADIRRSGIEEALSNQLNRAVDRMLDKMIDGLFDIDWSAIFSKDGGGGWASIADVFNRGGIAGQGGSGGGGIGSWISTGLDWLVGRNAQGTDFWKGGPTWVGERGPELLELPRGARVTEHNRSMQLAVASGAAQPPVTNNYFSGNLMTEEFWDRIQQGDRAAARAGANQGASMAVGVVRSTAAAEQHVQRMTKS